MDASTIERRKYLFSAWNPPEALMHRMLGGARGPEREEQSGRSRGMLARLWMGFVNWKPMACDGTMILKVVLAKTKTSSFFTACRDSAVSAI